MSDLSSHTEIKVGSERSFGLTFMIVFVIIGLFPVFFGSGVRWWAIAVAAVFGALAILAPSALSGPNRIWFRFGMLLNSIVSPIVMGVIFFVAVTPIALIRRVKNRDPLKQSFDPNAETYWINRQNDGVESDMRKQY